MKPSDSFHLFNKSYHKQLRELKKNQEQIRPDNIRKAIDMIMSCRGKLVLTGMGKSGIIAQKLSATFCSTGTAAFFLHPSESLHGDLGALQKEDILMLLTKSGESEEVVAMLQAVQRMGNPIISILGDPNSTAGRMSTVIIRAIASREADSLNLAPTASTTVTLVVGDSLAAAISELKGFRPEHFAIYHPGGQLGRRLLLNVEDLLMPSSKIPTLGTGESIKKLLQIDTDFSLGGVMIVDKRGRLIGIVTDGDIRRAILQYTNILDRTIPEIMTSNPIFVRKGSRASRALELMQDRPSQISVLPIVDSKDRPIGLLRLHDLFSARL